MCDERAQLAEVFKAHADEVFSFLMARCGRPEVAADIVSDVFIEAARRFADGRGHEVTIGWLKVVARRRLIDHWRSEERRRKRLDRLGSQRTAAATIDIDRIELAVDRLPDRQRAALSMRYLDDYSVSEIAEALSTSYRGAESLLSRARRSFAAAYEEMS